MANETTTATADDVFLSEIITEAILLEIRPMNVMRPFFRVAPAGPSKTYKFPKQDDEAPSAVTSPLGEAVDLTNTELSTSSATVTAAQMGIMTTVTDLLKTISIVDALPHFQGVLARTMAEKIETDLAANLANFSNVTDGGADVGLDDFLAAIAALEQRDINTSQLVAVLHPKQVGNLRSSLIAQSGTYWGTEKSEGNGLVQRQVGGYVADLFGVPIHMTSLVPTSDAGANRAGAIFASGEALGLYELWGVRAEQERNASLLATEIVLSACFGTAEIDDSRGQTVKSDV